MLRCLLDLVEEEFEPATLRAFRRLALEGAAAQRWHRTWVCLWPPSTWRNRVSCSASARRRRASSTDTTARVGLATPACPLAVAIALRWLAHRHRVRLGVFIRFLSLPGVACFRGL